jgi:hypothetical protein
MLRAPLYRLAFLAAVALVAGAFGDWAVESAANAGAFGGGYRDHDQSGVVPALLGGLFLIMESAVVRAAILWRKSGTASRRGIIDVAAHMATRSRGDFALIFTLQIAVVFAIEQLEALAGGGSAPQGTAWLGGPPAVSLAVHALVGMGCLQALRALMRAALAAFVSIARVTAGFTLIPRASISSGAYVRRRREPPFRVAPAAAAYHAGGRAPPHQLLGTSFF